MSTKPWRIAAAIVCSMYLAAACTGDSGRATTVQVFAAASLAEAFETIEQAYEADHENVDVVLNLAGSSTLAAQIIEGAPADVFAAANTQTMTGLQQRALLGTAPQTFATNRLTLVVPQDNPGLVTSLADLARPEIQVSLCALEVPCGLAAAQLLGRAGVTIEGANEEPNVRAALRRVEQSEVDAALVYVTDAMTSDLVLTQDVGDAQVIGYPIAVLDQTSVPETARAFVDFVLGSDGQQILRERGFGTP